jgi:hypothetical protein
VQESDLDYDSGGDRRRDCAFGRACGRGLWFPFCAAENVACLLFLSLPRQQGADNSFQPVPRMSIRLILTPAQRRFATKLADGVNEVMQGNWGYASGAMRILRKTEEQDGLSFGWQVLVFLAALAAVFSRLPGTLLYPQFYAEDGWVWYQQAYNLGWLRPLLMTQAGFLQTLPRLVADVALLFPMQWAPLIMNLSGAVVQVLPVTALLSRRCTTWGPLPVRVLMGVIYIAIPNAPEVHIVLTNAMWHLAVLQALLALSVPPLGWRGRVLLVLALADVSLASNMGYLRRKNQSSAVYRRGRFGAHFDWRPPRMEIRALAW